MGRVFFDYGNIKPEDVVLMVGDAGGADAADVVKVWRDDMAKKISEPLTAKEVMKNAFPFWPEKEIEDTLRKIG